MAYVESGTQCLVLWRFGASLESYHNYHRSTNIVYLLLGKRGKLNPPDDPNLLSFKDCLVSCCTVRGFMTFCRQMLYDVYLS